MHSLVTIGCLLFWSATCYFAGRASAEKTLHRRTTARIAAAISRRPEERGSRMIH